MKIQSCCRLAFTSTVLSLTLSSAHLFAETEPEGEATEEGVEVAPVASGSSRYHVQYESPAYGNIYANMAQSKHIYLDYLTTFGSANTKIFNPLVADPGKFEVYIWNESKLEALYTVLPPLTLGLSYQQSEKKLDFSGIAVTNGVDRVSNEKNIIALEGAYHWNHLFYVGFRLQQTKYSTVIPSTTLETESNGMELSVLVPIGDLDLRLDWTPSTRLIEATTKGTIEVREAGETSLSLFARGENSMVGGSVIYQRHEEVDDETGETLKNTVNLLVGYEAKRSQFGYGTYIRYMPKAYEDNSESFSFETINLYKLILFGSYDISPNMKTGLTYHLFYGPEETVNYSPGNKRTAVNNLMQVAVDFGYVF